MILPGSYGCILPAVGFLHDLRGVMANMQKLAGGRWRFELFSFDFAFEAVLGAVLAALTLGSLDSRELTIQTIF